MDRNRILLLFGAAWVSAAVLTWFLYNSTAKPKQEVKTTIYASTRDLITGTVVKKPDLKKIQVLSRDLPKGAILAEKDALDRVALFPVAANAPLIGTGLSPQTGAEGMPATIEPGFRAVSVTISDVSGVAGLVQPGTHVDVMFTRPGTMTEAITSTILQNVRVLAVGRQTQAGQVADPKASKMPVATLIVTPEDAQKLELAKNQGKISLSLRNPLDQTAGLTGKPVNTDVLDPAMRVKIAQSAKFRDAKGDLTDPKVWQELTGEKPKGVEKPPPPPKPLPPVPRAVIEVYRGEKHVQQVFP
ncbi:MAG: Flp pilus assembly protein CpaB [Acidobacteriia bacterium]|nr:Flp pilus assembly protein CpaB [Terriglobia bacterium]